MNVLCLLSYRPESYSDDIELAAGLTEGNVESSLLVKLFVLVSVDAEACLSVPCTVSQDAEERLFAELNTGAESGWDFSHRWYIDSHGNNNGSLRDIQTSQILPADLNALLYRNERTLASFHHILGEDGEHKPI